MQGPARAQGWELESVLVLVLVLVPARVRVPVPVPVLRPARLRRMSSPS
ncbi:hypothetical protein [Variovorax sp. PBL-H6]|nr:hypothetical protein [Variovorax sp. PBL-H6]